MIESISNATAATAADLSSKAATGNKTLYHTPFGDVMVDELATTNLKEVFSGNAPVASSTAPTAPTTPTAPAGPSAPAAPSAAAPAAASKPDPHSIPTAQSVFGEKVWIDAPTGTGPNVKWNYNPIYFATKETAQKIATQLGGTVVEANAIAPNGPMRQDIPNQMIQLSDGRQVNAGLVADLYNHGYPQNYVDYLIDCEVRGA